MSADQPRAQQHALVSQTRRRQRRQATLNSFFTAPIPPSPPSSPSPPSPFSALVSSPPPDLNVPRLDAPIPADVLTPSCTEGPSVPVCNPPAAACSDPDCIFVTPNTLRLNLPPRPVVNTVSSQVVSLSIIPSLHTLQTATCSAASGLPSPPLSPPASQSQRGSNRSAQQQASLDPSIIIDATPTTATTTMTSIGVNTPTNDPLSTFPAPSPPEKDVSRNVNSRKRLRHSLTPPPPSRPRTRASLRAAVRSPSPPAPAAVVTVPNSNNLSNFSQLNRPSRLNRARNAARRSTTVANSNVLAATTATVAAKVAVVDEIESDDVTPINVPESIDSSPADVDASSDESAPEKMDFRCRQQKVKMVEPVLAANAFSQKKRPLHPFFSATATAVSSFRDRPKVPRLDRPICDAWCCPNATVHVNAPPPLSCPPSPQSNSISPISTGPNFSSLALPTSPLPKFKFGHFVSQKSGNLEPQVRSRPDIKECVDDSGLWTERYKTDTRLDTINAPLAADLCDWLRAWYEKRGLGNIDDGSGSEASIMSELDEDGLVIGEKETIAVITGPVGCGKTTLVGTAARTMGLSILEINSSVCRSGRRVRDIVGDALTSHRVGGGVKGGTLTTASSIAGLESNPNSKSQSKVSLAKTLILFEEVDELQADEKGFWTSVLELASSSDCKRPIVCTANSFTSTMRQFFLEKRAVTRTDFDRLLVNTNEELLPNTVLFKHIAFPYTRSERQTSSVLQRVALTEGIGAHRHLCDGLSVMHRYDTRRAINQLQFWGSVGIDDVIDKLHDGEKSTKTVTLSESQLQAGMDFIRSGVEHSIGPSVFTTGATNYCKKYEAQGGSLPANGGIDNSLETLTIWAMSLEVMSECDVLGGMQVRQTQTRNAEARLLADTINLDADLFQSGQISEDLMVQALEVSRPKLTFFQTNTYVRDVAMHASSLQQDCVTERSMMPMFPHARRPVVTDVMPVLISMVRAEDERKCKAQTGEPATPLAPIRRTRLRSRQCGLSALDLDVATLSVLRKASIAPR